MTSPQPRIGVLRFPGACDDRDALWALSALDAEALFVWHTETELPDLDAVVLPGGFSYGSAPAAPTVPAPPVPPPPPRRSSGGGGGFDLGDSWSAGPAERGSRAGRGKGKA